MYFEIVTASGGFRANIKGDNHELVFQTEVYEGKSGAKNAIDMVKTEAATATTQDEA